MRKDNAISMPQDLADVVIAWDRLSDNAQRAIILIVKEAELSGDPKKET